MYPEDRVLVAYVPEPADFARIEQDGWYRIPVRCAPKGLHAEYIAFYFGNRFGDEKWAIHYYAANMGHELTTRLSLIPSEPEHERAGDLYYKVQLGPLIRRQDPIVSLRWRRVTFIHTTWDRFQDAAEINDLFVQGDPYVDRIYATLKERGIQAERNYGVNEPQASYILPLVVPCHGGLVEVPPDRLPRDALGVDELVDKIVNETMERGGVL
ncbi:MAG: hypothetical protein ACK2UV_04910 [Candidatus Promineifilaceae bacterium]